MADGIQPGWRFRVIDYIALGFILVAIEELWRHPRLWYSWLSALCAGFICAWFGDAAPAIKEKFLRLWRFLKNLFIAPSENIELKKKIAECTQEVERIKDEARREKIQQDSDLWRAQESLRQCEEERRAALARINELNFALQETENRSLAATMEQFETNLKLKNSVVRIHGHSYVEGDNEEICSRCAEVDFRIVHLLDMNIDGRGMRATCPQCKSPRGNGPPIPRERAEEAAKRKAQKL